MDLQALHHALLAPPAQLGVIADLQAIRPQFHLHLQQTVPSTNTVLWDLIDQGAPVGTAVIAEQQDTGRGQWGRTWQSALGGLYLSLYLEPDKPAIESNTITLASAWGITMALQQLGLPIGIKWPNDLVFNGLKLGGILTETRFNQGKLSQTVIGVGLNWNNPVPESGITLRRVLQHHPIVSLSTLEQLAAIVLYGIIQGYWVWQQKGITDLIERYEQVLVNLGQVVKIDGHLGNVVGVSTTGSLRIRLDSDKLGDEIAEICLKPGEISLGYGM